jgi:hypothetical protein
VVSVLVALVLLYFLPTIIRGFTLGLPIAVAFAFVARAQTNTTDCHRNGSATVYDTCDQSGRTSCRTECWPNGSSTRCYRC